MELTAKGKAKELVEKYFEIFHKSSDLELSWKVCKKLSLIAVDEILKYKKGNETTMHFYPCSYAFCTCGEFWVEVKQEINNL